LLTDAGCKNHAIEPVKVADGGFIIPAAIAGIRGIAGCAAALCTTEPPRDFHRCALALV